MTSGLGSAFTFDVANRSLSAAETSGGIEYYGYAPDNRRIFKKLTSGAEEYTFYGGRGEKLGVYNLTGSTMHIGDLRVAGTDFFVLGRNSQWTL